MRRIDWIDFPQSCTPTWKTRFWEKRAQSLKTGWIIVLINRPREPLGPAAQKLSWFRTNPFRKVSLTCCRLEISNKKNRFFESDTQVYPLNFFLVTKFEKNFKTYRQLQLIVKLFAKCSLKRSWQTFFVVLCCIFQISKKTFCKIKKLPYMYFYRNLVTWSDWSIAVKEMKTAHYLRTKCFELKVHWMREVFVNWII